MPHGPALLGPTRLCMPDTTLRSYQIISIVDTRPSPKMTSTLTMTMIKGVHNRPPSSSGSSANIRLVRS